MTLARTGDLIAAAVRVESAVLAFNVISLEHAEGIVAGAERAGAGLILQVSENAIGFHGGRMRPLLAACAELARAADVPIGIHLDHFQDVALAEQGIRFAGDLGVSSVMVDAAALAWDDNVVTTTSFAGLGHAAGLWVEAELGEIGGKDGAHTPGVRTDPADAARFVEATGVDGLAVAVGSAHAMTTKGAVIDIALIERLAAAVRVPLVLHGSSGVPDELLRRGVRAGIRKVNIGTALNVAFTGEVRRYLDGNPDVADPRRYLAPARHAVAARVAQLCGALTVR